MGAAVVLGMLILLGTMGFAGWWWWTGASSAAVVGTLVPGLVFGGLFVRIGYRSAAFRCLELRPDRLRLESVALGWWWRRSIAVDPGTRADLRESWSREETYYVTITNGSGRRLRFAAALDDADSTFLVDFVNRYVTGHVPPAS